ncbi:hypothetical protein [Cellulomonas sp. PhB150]|uniref:hypothetical protein n=1 Tax=Cellulomonas sp. PhB150 TaxID=2485188 RepID=UPI000F4910E8|nr:hypothetical protein [Cellulomonas sp. PhB150]ROS23872.1 hypothetical protein EDF34_2934 [Cellulomonas sp. PhB150]
MLDDPVPFLLSALDASGRARRCLVAAGGVPWSGAVAVRYRSEIDVAVLEAAALDRAVGELVALVGCRV